MPPELRWQTRTSPSQSPEVTRGEVDAALTANPPMLRCSRVQSAPTTASEERILRRRSASFIVAPAAPASPGERAYQVPHGSAAAAGKCIRPIVLIVAILIVAANAPRSGDQGSGIGTGTGREAGIREGVETKNPKKPRVETPWDLGLGTWDLGFVSRVTSAAPGVARLRRHRHHVRRGHPRLRRIHHHRRHAAAAASLR